MDTSFYYDQKYYDRLKEAVEANRQEDDTIYWQGAFEVMSSIYPTLPLTREGLRSQARRKFGNLRMYDKERWARVYGRSPEKKFLSAISEKCSVPFLRDLMKWDEDKVIAEAMKLKLSGYPGIAIWSEEGAVWVRNMPKRPASRNTIPVDVYSHGRTLTFGVVSDTHIGSNKSRLDAVHRFYEMCDDENISEIFHVGDVTDGYYNHRPVSIFEQDAVGFTEQLHKVVDEYPHIPGITTYFITGNHDATHYRNGFADIGDAISRMREDMVYLGHNFAKIALTENLKMSLIHPTDGVTKSLSLKLQHIIDGAQVRKADIMLVGHYHKSVQVKYRGVHGFLVPSFQDRTNFMEDLGLQSDVAGMIFYVDVDDEGNLMSISTKYIDFEELG